MTLAPEHASTKPHGINPRLRVVSDAPRPQRPATKKSGRPNPAAHLTPQDIEAIGHELDALRTRLLPLASMLTPNIPEAALLAGRRIDNATDADAALETLRRMGSHALLLKGGHLDEGADVVDRYEDAATTLRFTHRRLPLEGHGTGCTLASAIAANLCRGLSLPDATRAATDYVGRALELGYRPGRGDLVVLDHFGAAPARAPEPPRANPLDRRIL